MIPILFDLDGTITDPKPGFLASVDFALRSLGESGRKESELLQFIGPPLRNTFATLLETDDPERIEKALILYRERLDNGGKFEAEVYPGMRELLKRLSDQGYPLFVATGKPRCVATEIIAHFELSHYFIQVYGAELDGRFVDKAELIEHLFQEQSLQDGQGVMIGDTAFDIRAGRLNQLETIGVSWGYGTDDQMQSEAVGFIVPDVIELERAIDRLGRVAGA
ncbi:HAD hydrolase-like protein [Verrucomicrobiales bacterium]|jgi:phosphoglycolate phosphatase|nr:HAD hydrolase-like protein [Verrucomicrobiales bacterium]